MGDTASARLIWALQAHPSLTRLILRANDIGKRGAEALTLLVAPKYVWSGTHATSWLGACHHSRCCCRSDSPGNFWSHVLGSPPPSRGATPTARVPKLTPIHGHRGDHSVSRPGTKASRKRASRSRSHSRRASRRASRSASRVGTATTQSSLASTGTPIYSETTSQAGTFTSEAHSATKLLELDVAWNRIKGASCVLLFHAMKRGSSLRVGTHVV